VGDVVIPEDPGHLADRVGLTDVGEELVAHAFTFGGSAHDSGDVHELDRGRQDLLRAVDRGEFFQPWIGHSYHSDIWFDRRERVVRGEHVVLGQGIEEG